MTFFCCSKTYSTMKSNDNPCSWAFYTITIKPKGARDCAVLVIRNKTLEYGYKITYIYFLIHRAMCLLHPHPNLI